MSDHKKLSFIKSFVRIFGYVLGAVAFGDNVLGFFAFVVLIAAEIIGILEEVDE